MLEMIDLLMLNSIGKCSMNIEILFEKKFRFYLTGRVSLGDLDLNSSSIVSIELKKQIVS